MAAKHGDPVDPNVMPVDPNVTFPPGVTPTVMLRTAPPRKPAPETEPEPASIEPVAAETKTDKVGE